MIREALPTDIPILSRAFAAGLEENPSYQKRGMSLDKVIAHVGQLIHSPNGLVLISEPFNCYLLARCGSEWWSTNKEAAILSLYAPPYKRGTRDPYRCIQWFINWAKQKQCNAIYATIDCEATYQRSIRFFEHFGFKPSSHLRMDL